MIKSIQEIKQDILDIKHGKIKQGLGIGIPPIDNHLRFATRGSFEIVIGHANVGKTTFLTYLFTLWAYKHQAKFLIWSSENTPQSIARKIIEFKMQKPIEIASEDNIQDALNWCNKHFKIIDVNDSYTYKEVLEEAEAVLNIWKYDALLIDPYNSLVQDRDDLKVLGNQHLYDYMVATKFRLFAKQNKVSLYLNCHGVTESSRKVHPSTHPYAGHPMPLQGSQVEGGVKMINRSDQMYCVHRYVHHDDWMFTDLHVLKVKEIESYGARPTPLDDPIRVKMKKNNVGFEFCGKDLMGKEVEEIKMQI